MTIETEQISKKILKTIIKLQSLDLNTENIEHIYKEILKILSNEFKFSTCFLIENNEQKTIYNLNKLKIKTNNQELLNTIFQDIITLKKPFIVNNLKQKKDQPISSFISFPITEKDKVHSIIVLGKVKQKKINKNLIKIFKPIISKINIIINHLNETKKATENEKAIKLLFNLNKIKRTSNDLNKYLKFVIEEITEIFDSDLALITTYQNNKLKIEFSNVPLTSTILTKNSKQINQSIIETIKEGISTIQDYQNSEIKSILSQPMYDENENLIGIITLVKKQTNPTLNFKTKEQKLLKLFSDEIKTSIIINNKNGYLKELFGQYVSKDLLQQILDPKNKINLKGETKELTVLFSDIRGFTSFSEKHKPEKVFKLLNKHLEVMSKIIVDNKGTIDKFVGDEIMALFGAPIAYESHALKAIESAIEMIKAQKKLIRTWKLKEKTSFNIGIGISTGKMVIGSIGSKQKLDYTVIGDNVNIGARLCSIAKEGEIIISENTYREVQKFVKVKKLEPVKVKGKSKPLQIYQVIKLIDN